MVYYVEIDARQCLKHEDEMFSWLEEYVETGKWKVQFDFGTNVWFSFDEIVDATSFKLRWV